MKKFLFLLLLLPILSFANVHKFEFKIKNTTRDITGFRIFNGTFENIEVSLHDLSYKSDSEDYYESFINSLNVTYTRSNIFVSFILPASLYKMRIYRGKKSEDVLFGVDRDGITILNPNDRISIR